MIPHPKITCLVLASGNGLIIEQGPAYASGENYFPEGLQGRRYYQPVERGLEIKIREKLMRLRGEKA